MSESLSSSLKACLRFLSIGSCTWLLLSQVLSLSTVAFIEAESDLPEASLFTPPMTVASPMSCMAIEVGIPPLDRSSFSSLEKALHSGSGLLDLLLDHEPAVAADELSAVGVHYHRALPAPGALVQRPLQLHQSREISFVGHSNTPKGIEPRLQILAQIFNFCVKLDTPSEVSELDRLPVRVRRA